MKSLASSGYQISSRIEKGRGDVDDLIEHLCSMILTYFDDGYQ